MSELSPEVTNISEPTTPEWPVSEPTNVLPAGIAEEVRIDFAERLTKATDETAKRFAKLEAKGIIPPDELGQRRQLMMGILARRTNRPNRRTF